jgi:uncharacterized membrane protein YdjX (TVP38/TMEM64 family)
MSSDPAGPAKKLPVLKIVIVLLVLGAVGVLVLRGLDWRAWLEVGMGWVRSAGPVAFFVAMAIAPGLGVPVIPFDLAAGPVFGEQLGMPLVVALSIASLCVNMLLTYALARRALRPVLEKLMARLGYRLPQMDAGDLVDLTIVMRVTPGMPFCVQNYLLGLAGVPFVRYVLISVGVIGVYTAGIVLFGDALLHGKGKMAIVAVSLLIVAVVITHWARKHYAKKKG